LGAAINNQGRPEPGKLTPITKPAIEALKDLNGSVDVKEKWIEKLLNYKVVPSQC